jgi:hypothetical protein
MFMVGSGRTVPKYDHRQIADKRDRDRRRAEEDRALAKEGASCLGGKTSEFRILPGKLKSPVSTVVYGNKVAQVIWSKPKAIVIVDKETADSHRTYFEYIWDKTKK